MKFRKIYMLFISLMACYYLSAQNQFSKRYSFNIPGDIFSSLVIKGDSILLLGVSGDTSDNSVEIHASKIISCVFDANGNNNRHYIYNGDYQKTYGSCLGVLIKTPFNSYAVCGIDMDSTGLRKALFVQYDSLLKMTKIKEYQYPDSVLTMAMQNMIRLKNGDFVMVGEIQNLFYAANIFVLKIDSAGNLIWLKTYSSQSLSDIYPYIIELTDTILLIGCEHSNELQGPYSITSQTKFMIIDTAGNLLNQWMDSNDSTFAPYGLLKTKDGGYAYCGRYKTAMTAPYGDVLTDGVITRLDSNFNLMWRRLNTTSPVNDGIFYQLRELYDGSLVAAGQGISFNEVSQTGEYTGWFVKVSSNGDRIWSRMYRGTPGYPGSSNTNVINDFQVLPNGDIIGCGESDDAAASYESQQAWLIRLDSMGCLIPGCDTLTATGINPVTTNGTHTGIVVYPNPANSMAYILIKTDNPNPQLSFNIYNATGQLLTTQTGAQPDITYLLHVSSYASGIYFVQVLSDGVVVANSKFVKE